MPASPLPNPDVLQLQLRREVLATAGRPWPLASDSEVHQHVRGAGIGAAGVKPAERAVDDEHVIDEVANLLSGPFNRKGVKVVLVVEPWPVNVVAVKPRVGGGPVVRHAG